MPKNGGDTIVCSISTQLSTDSVDDMTDGQLLERFLGRRDEGAEAAFAALVGVHGPMVWDVCRGILPDTHAAEDAFQATFLLLARRAGSIRRRDAVGPWLYRVARRVAGRAKTAAIRRRQREGRVTEMKATPDAGPDPAGADRGAARGGRPAGGEIPRPAGALLLRGPDARRGRPAAGMPGRHGQLPPVAGPRAAPGSTDPPGAGPARRLGGRDAPIAKTASAAMPAGLAEVDDQGGDESRGRQGDDDRDRPGLDRPARTRRDPHHDLHETDDDRGGRGGDRARRDGYRPARGGRKVDSVRAGGGRASRGRERTSAAPAGAGRTAKGRRR